MSRDFSHGAVYTGYVTEHLINNDIVSISRPSGNRIKEFPSRRVGQKLGKVFKSIVNKSLFLQDLLEKWKVGFRRNHFSYAWWYSLWWQLCSVLRPGTSWSTARIPSDVATSTSLLHWCVNRSRWWKTTLSPILRIYSTSSSVKWSGLFS